MCVWNLWRKSLHIVYVRVVLSFAWNQLKSSGVVVTRLCNQRTRRWRRQGRRDGRHLRRRTHQTVKGHTTMSTVLPRWSNARLPCVNKRLFATLCLLRQAAFYMAHRKTLLRQFLRKYYIFYTLLKYFRMFSITTKNGVWHCGVWKGENSVRKSLFIIVFLCHCDFPEAEYIFAGPLCNEFMYVYM